MKFKYIVGLFIATVIYGAGVSSPPAKVQKLSTGETIDEFSFDVKIATADNREAIDANAVEITTKQDDLSTTTWKAANSELWNGLDKSTLTLTYANLIQLNFKIDGSSVAANYLNLNQYIPGFSLTVQETDGTNKGENITLLVFATGTVLIDGATAYVTNTGGGGGTAGVTSIIAGAGISVDQATGDVTVTATGGGGAVASTQTVTLLRGFGNAPIYTSTETTKPFGTWFQPAQYSGDVIRFDIYCSSPTTETPTIKVWQNSTLFTDLTAVANSTHSIHLIETVDISKRDLFGIDFNNVGNNPWRGVSISMDIAE